MSARDISKLPQWAQDRIALSERNAEYYKGKLTQVETGDTNVFVWNYPDSTPLPRDTTIEFLLTNGDKISVKHNDEGDSLHVMSYNGGIAVRPRSSNVIEVNQVKL